MPQNYVPVFLFIAVVGALIPLTLLLAKLVRPSSPGKAKLSPYAVSYTHLTLPTN